jgi:CheY-like chemotaxis protein
MPVMDGTSTIKHIMIKKPCPVVITSNPGDGSSKTIFNFLELGAVDFMSKPTKNQDILVQQQKIIERVKIAATATVKNFRIARSPQTNSRKSNRKSGRYGVPPSGDCDFRSRRAPGTDESAVRSGAGHGRCWWCCRRPSESAAVVSRNLCPLSTRTVWMPGLTHRPGNAAFGRAMLCGYSWLPPCCENGWPATGHRPCLTRHRRVGPVDRILSTAASVFRHRLTVVLLSGANTGEQSGLREVHEMGDGSFFESGRRAWLPHPSIRWLRPALPMRR